MRIYFEYFAVINRVVIKNPTFCPHNASVCFFMVLQTDRNFSLYSSSWWFLITEKAFVYCAIRNDFFNQIQINFSLKAV